MLRPELQGDIAGLGDVARRGLRVVNREPGSEARSVLDRELGGLGIGPGETGRLPGYDTRAAGHLQVAAANAAGLADCDPGRCGEHIATLLPALAKPAVKLRS